MDDETLPPLDDEDKMLSGLCYPFWMIAPGFVLASSKRQDPFLLFHALQGLAVGVLASAGSVVGLVFLWVMFSSLPVQYTMASGVLGGLLVMAALAVAGLAFLVSIFLGWQASSGRYFRLPVLGEWCETKMGALLELTASELEEAAQDRKLVPEEKVVVLAPVSTPEQMRAEMDLWARSTAQQSWWGGNEASSEASPVPQEPVARLSPLRTSESSVRPLSSTPAKATPTATPEVKPWRPALAETPAQETAVKARPVSFPSVKRGSEERPAQEPKKWWKPD